MSHTGAASAEEALLRLLETQEEQDRWLLENKNAINAKISSDMGPERSLMFVAVGSCVSGPTDRATELRESFELVAVL